MLSFNSFIWVAMLLNTARTGRTSCWNLSSENPFNILLHLFSVSSEETNGETRENFTQNAFEYYSVDKQLSSTRSELKHISDICFIDYEYADWQRQGEAEPIRVTFTHDNRPQRMVDKLEGEPLKFFTQGGLVPNMHMFMIHMVGRLKSWRGRLKWVYLKKS